ncbi:hypothetical protein PGQ11_001204 [Apiospora arundinis]|uniref:C2H2-type domain-containing protein n=1 Tax=Apiospora arundinis TaxID=335852 RepID=A0ABR2JMC7_9PEZI
MALGSEFARAITEFKRDAGLSREQLDQFQLGSLDDLHRAMGDIQRNQAHDRKLRYLRRLDPFLKSMKEYEKVIEVFLNASEILAFVWGPLKFILTMTSNVVDAFDAFLNIYQEIGENLSNLSSYQSLFSNHSHMQTLLVTIFKDILAIHKEAVVFLKKKFWQQLFQGAWKGFEVRIKEIKRNFSRHRHLIENRASLIEFEEVQVIRQQAEAGFAHATQADLARQHREVLQWLAPVLPEKRHDIHRRAREDDAAAGKWLLDDDRFRMWSDKDCCATPLVWMNGKPGAGKSVLASIIADHVFTIPDVSVGLFYCVQSDPHSNSFISVAKSILSQLLTQDATLLPLVYEKMRTENGEAVLTSNTDAEKLLNLALRSRKTYLIIDGVDECERDERKKICSWFSKTINSLERTKADEIRCIFVSQDDGIARRDLAAIPAINITTKNTERDIQVYSKVWQAKIEQKFGTFHEHELSVAKVVTARSQGMFIYAKCVLAELYHQASREELLSRWRADGFPNDLDEVYVRILQRITEGLPIPTVERVRQLLGWVCCAKRPLKWYEIQVAASIDLRSDQVIVEGRRLVDNAKDLCASFVEVHADQTVELVHSTVREFLKNSNTFQVSEAEKDLTLISIAYLCIEPIEREVDEAVLETALLAGSYGFLEYASVCWVPHLLSWLQDGPADEDIPILAESLEVLLDSHFLEQEHNIQVPHKVMRTLGPLEDLDIHTSIMQAVVWTRKQIMGSHSSLEAEDRLDFPQIISRFRSSLEMYLFLSGQDTARASLATFYGNNWFKCPRMSCRYFHHGFASRDLRDQHVARHDRAYLCTFEGCLTATLGCATRAELQRHMLESHGIVGEEDSFPSMSNPDTKPKATGPAKFHCSQCSKTFTRSANLQGHQRSHRNERPFACEVCGMTFVRQHDKKRHEETRHADERKYICHGYLRDGSSWGCQRNFARADVLSDHHKSQTGRSCIRPLFEEKKAELGDITEVEILSHITQLKPIPDRADTLATLGSSISRGSGDDEFAELELEQVDTSQSERVESSSQKRSLDNSGSEELAELHKARRFQFKKSYIRHSATRLGGEGAGDLEDAKG